MSLGDTTMFVQTFELFGTARAVARYSWGKGLALFSADDYSSEKIFGKKIKKFIDLIFACGNSSVEKKAAAGDEAGCFGEPAIQVGASPPVFGSHYSLRTRREDGLASAEGLVWFGSQAGSYRFAKNTSRHSHGGGKFHIALLRTASSRLLVARYPLR